jgi:hypothetical protein
MYLNTEICLDKSILAINNVDQREYICFSKVVVGDPLLGVFLFFKHSVHHISLFFVWQS